MGRDEKYFPNPDDDDFPPPKKPDGPVTHAPGKLNACKTLCGMRGLESRVAKERGATVTCGVCRRMLAIERRHAVNPVTGETECGRRPLLGLKTNVGGEPVTCAKCLRAINPKASDRGAGP